MEQKQTGLSRELNTPGGIQALFLVVFFPGKEQESGLGGAGGEARAGRVSQARVLPAEWFLLPGWLGDEN